MKIKLSLLALSLVLFRACSAQLYESFDYADGPLTEVSGGTWQLWPGTTRDVRVENGKAHLETGFSAVTADVIRPFDGVLKNWGDSTRFSFDFSCQWVTRFSEDYHFYMSPWVDGQQIIGNSLFFTFSKTEDPNSLVTMIALEGNGSTWELRELGRFSRETEFHVSGIMTRANQYVSYVLNVNGYEYRPSIFSLTRSEGINLAEMFGRSFDSRMANGAFDNIVIEPVPEPGAALVFVSGGLAFLRRRRKLMRQP